MNIEETTFSLNIKILGDSSHTARIQVESLPAMSQTEFFEWLFGACKRGELPRTSRPSREVWRDTKESPQPKHILKQMDEFSLQYKKFKRKYPKASAEKLNQLTKDYLEERKKILESFEESLKIDF